MPANPQRNGSPARRPSDPFRALAISSIILGMLIVIGGAVFWTLTGRESSLLIGAGVTLTIGGGLRNVLVDLVDQLPIYLPPPEELPPSDTPAQRRRRRARDER
jgi:hypothetical protein